MNKYDFYTRNAQGQEIIIDVWAETEEQAVHNFTQSFPEYPVEMVMRAN